MISLFIRHRGPFIEIRELLGTGNCQPTDHDRDPGMAVRMRLGKMPLQRKVTGSSIKEMDADSVG